MNYLKNGDFDNANSVFEIEDSFATRINKAVIALIQNDLGVAIANVTELIHDLDDLGLRDNFVKAICGDAFSITEEELAHLFIDTLLGEKDASELKDLFQDHGVSQDDDDYLTQKSVDILISRINAEIAKAKAVERDDANANLRAGKALMNNTKSDLAAVKELLGESDMKYQMLADDLANTILQCGINYYNNNDDDDIDNVMVLQKYACKIAVGKLCKDRCNKNLAILEKKKVEKSIEADVSFIANQLQAFQTKSDTIDNARNLVNDCKPHLVSIKNQIGSQNDTYLQISSAVANNALGMIVTVINNAQNISSSPYSISSHITNIVDLKSKIDSAINVMNLIGDLDMTSAERSHYDTNKSSLNNIKSHVDSAISSIPNHTHSSVSSTSSSLSNSDDSKWGCIIWIIVALVVGAVGWAIVESWVGLIIGVFIVLAIYGKVN